jgi:hypothetical protein
VVEELRSWKGIVVMLTSERWYRATEDEWDMGRTIVFKCSGQLTEDEETFATGLTEDGRSVKLRLIYWEFKELTELEVALL